MASKLSIPGEKESFNKESPHSAVKREDDASVTKVTYRLNLPSFTNGTRIQVPVFQHPYQLISFSYNAYRVLEFNDSSLNYYVEAPLNADLSYRYEYWIQKSEERGRLDGLLEACLKVEHEHKRADVISWRGVMTK